MNTTTDTREIRIIDGVEHVFEACGRCGGCGRFSFNLRDLDKCYGCNGMGGRWVEKADSDRRAHNRALAAARRERKRAQEEATREDRVAKLHADLVEAHPLLAELTYLGNVDLGDGYGSNYGGLLGGLRRKLEKYGSLSEGQIALAEKVIREGMERQAEQDTKPAVEPVAAGRHTVSGTVTRVESRENQYGVRLVMTVELDGGARVWGTAPNGANEGDHITFTATFDPQGDDFAFFTRPRMK